MATVSVEIEDAEMEATTNTTTTRFVRLIPNERKKVEQIRATSGPHVGQRVRLKVAALEDAMAMEEEEEEEMEAKKAIVRTSSVLRSSLRTACRSSRKLNRNYQTRLTVVRVFPGNLER